MHSAGPGSVSRQVYDDIFQVTTQLEMQLQESQAQLQNFQAQLHASESHCMMMILQHNLFQEQHKICHKSKGHHVNLFKHACFLTQPEGREEFRRLAQECCDKACEEAEEKARNVAEKVVKECIQAIVSVLQVFNGSLASYRTKKDELLNLAAALNLSTEGNKEQLYKHISDHVLANPLLASNPRFTLLFNGGRQGQRLASETGNSRSQPAAMDSQSSSASTMDNSQSGHEVAPQYFMPYIHFPHQVPQTALLPNFPTQQMIPSPNIKYYVLLPNLGNFIPHPTYTGQHQ